LAKKNTAKIRSIAGKTTLLTTVLICPEASFHVPSIASATSPPAAKAVVENSMVAMRATRMLDWFWLFGMVCIHIIVASW